MRRLLACLGAGLLVALAGAAATLAEGPPVLALPGTVVVDVENVTSGVATFSVEAQDGDGNPLAVSCDHSSGDSFPLGTTTVNCSATDALAVTTSGSFSVVVRDTTFPALDLPVSLVVDVNGVATTTVTYSATASDGGSSVPVSCSPPSGSSFPLGATHVACSATDGAGNTSSGGFDVTLQDTTPPTLSLPANISTTVNGAASKAVGYAASATDGGTPLTPSCSPASGSAFPLGTTTVSCGVADPAGNTANGSFTITVEDGTPPAVSITSSPSGTVKARAAEISFTTSEGTTSCQLDGGGFSACGSPASYSGLADGAHAFVVRAVDAAGNTGTAAATWSVDGTPPSIAIPRSAIVIEADGPTGGNATYFVTASDNGAPLPPAAVSCTPRSGSKFRLGESGVTCTAADAYGNVATAGFKIVVRDTTPPAINAPDVSLEATSAAGIRRGDSDLASYLAHVTATDLVSTPTLTNNAPDVLPVGTTTVTFTAKDVAGNTATKRATITVLPLGKPAPAPDLTPPANPTGIVAKAGDRRIELSWKVGADVSYVTVTLFVVGKATPGQRVYRGSARTHAARGLRNDTTYRFVLVAWDRAGNQSRGAVVRATPRAELLASPEENQRVLAPPLLRWKSSAGASYYNVQLWRGKHKVLSSWPSVARLQLTKSWVYDGNKQKLSPGAYTWYVWPGLGARASARYGRLLGSRTFVVVAKQTRPQL